MIVADTRPQVHVVLLGVWLGFPHGMAATNRVRLLALAMRDGGADVRVVCARAVDTAIGGANRSPRGSWRGIPFEYPGGTSLRPASFVRRRIVDVWATVCTALRLVRLRRTGRLDCVYLYVAGQHWTPVAALLHALLRSLRVPIILELNELPWPMWRNQSALQRGHHPLAGVTGVVAISGYLTSWARREAQRRRQSLDVVQVPILVDVVEQRAPVGSDATPAVLFAGDVSPQNLDVLRLIVRALREVWRTIPECRLVCVGADPRDARLRAVLPQGPEGGFDARVEVPGFVARADLLALYARASALLLPLPADLTSIARFPTKLGEYLASRRPVITTDVGEVGFYLRHGESAFVTPPGDTAAFAAAITAVLEDPERAAQIGEAGSEVAQREFLYSRHSKALADLLRRCAGQEAS
jgi:glycosyltransferase involved in cell wall biosynthesis